MIGPKMIWIPGIKFGSLSPEERAERLLVEHLSAAQYEQYAGHRCFDCFGEVTRRLYLIMAVGILIERRANICVVPEFRVPTGDRMLAQKLWIEQDERHFLKIARIPVEWLVGSMYQVNLALQNEMMAGLPPRLPYPS